MKKILVKNFSLIVLFLSFLAPAQAMAQNKPVLKTAWLFMLKSEHRFLFDAQFTDRYKFAGPFSFEFGTGFGVNTTSLSSDLILGGVLGFPKRRWEITIRAAFITKWLYCFKNDVSDAVLAATFGPGFDYRFKNGRSIGFDLAFEVGRIMTHGKRLYFGIVPGLVFIF